MKKKTDRYFYPAVFTYEPNQNMGFSIQSMSALDNAPVDEPDKEERKALSAYHRGGSGVSTVNLPGWS